MFNSQSNLLHLNLDNNLIKKIARDDLVHLTRLNELSIAKNRLTFIDGNALDNLARLERLDLSGNMLLALPLFSRAYSGLVYLNVADNIDLVYFPGEWHFKELRVLRVHWAYHCCQFREASRKQPRLKRGLAQELIAVPFEARDHMDFELKIIEGHLDSIRFLF